jgi:hypothetical protein
VSFSDVLGHGANIGLVLGVNKRYIFVFGLEKLNGQITPIEVVASF